MIPTVPKLVQGNGGRVNTTCGTLWREEGSISSWQVEMLAMIAQSPYWDIEFHSPVEPGWYTPTVFAGWDMSLTPDYVSSLSQWSILRGV